MRALDDGGGACIADDDRPTGNLRGARDVGPALHPGSVGYDAAQKTYRITASEGEYPRVAAPDQRRARPSCEWGAILHPPIL